LIAPRDWKKVNDMFGMLRGGLLALAVSACGEPSSETGIPDGSASSTGSAGPGTGEPSTTGSSTSAAATTGSTVVAATAGPFTTGSATVGAGGSGSDAAGQPAGGSGGIAGSSDGGASDGVRYGGCMSIGAYDRVVIGKNDPDRHLCFTVVLVNPGVAPAGLTLPPRLGFEGASAGPATASCGAGVGAGTTTLQMTGTVERPDAGLGTRLNVDVTLSFPANDAGIPATERLTVRDLDVSSSCR
jgi:hypothetical protein